MTRAQLDALLWKGFTIPAGGTFIIPIDKIYEVYVYILGANPLLLNGSQFANPLAATGLWLPTNTGPFAAATDDSGVLCTAPHGWLFSSGEILSCASSFHIRWRDVTEQQLGS